MATEFLSTFAVASVCVATIGVGSVAAFVAWLLSSKITATDRLVVTWLVYNALTHFILVSSLACRLAYQSRTVALHVLFCRKDLFSIFP